MTTDFHTPPEDQAWNCYQHCYQSDLDGKDDWIFWGEVENKHATALPKMCVSLSLHKYFNFKEFLHIQVTVTSSFSQISAPGMLWEDPVLFTKFTIMWDQECHYQQIFISSYHSSAKIFLYIFNIWKYFWLDYINKNIWQMLTPKPEWPLGGKQPKVNKANQVL